MIRATTCRFGTIRTALTLAALLAMAVPLAARDPLRTVLDAE